MLCDELVLRADVVVEGDFGEVFEGRVVGGGRGLGVAEEGGDDDEVLLLMRMGEIE